jgi:hypothetical protein
MYSLAKIKRRKSEPKTWGMTVWSQ